MFINNPCEAYVLWGLKFKLVATTFLHYEKVTLLKVFLAHVRTALSLDLV